MTLGSFGNDINAAVIGASGGIGGAFAAQLESCPAVSRVFRLSRSSGGDLTVDVEDEATIAEAAKSIEAEAGELHLVLVTTGLLHDADAIRPEKAWRALDADALMHVFRVNAVGPALVAKHFLPLLPRDRRAAFAALSARVGSIADNSLGGWYAYRSSKAALNMLIRNLAIELARTRPEALCVGMHPGTVDTALSEPFQGAVPEGKLFTPEYAAKCLLDVLDARSPDDSGALFAWDGERIPY